MQHLAPARPLADLVVHRVKIRRSAETGRLLQQGLGLVDVAGIKRGAGAIEDLRLQGRADRRQIRCSSDRLRAADSRRTAHCHCRDRSVSLAPGAIAPAPDTAAAPAFCAACCVRAELRSRCRLLMAACVAPTPCSSASDAIGIAEVALLYGGVCHLQQALQHFLRRSLQRRTSGSRLLGLIQVVHGAIVARFDDVILLQPRVRPA